MRFKEFNTAWIHSKIGEICEIEMCKRIFSNQTNTIGGVPFYKIGTIGGKPDTWISQNLFNEYKDKYNYPKKGEILITCSGTVGKCIIFNGEDAYFQDSNIVWLANKSTVLNIFLFYIMNNIDWSYLNSTTITRIYGSDLRNLDFYYPNNKNEQQKVTEFLSLIDKRIDTQSKIIEKYESLISTIRTNIFSSFQCKWTKLCDLVENKSLQLNRGNIIPKHPKDDVYKYPVYSSSVQKDGLMGYSDYYMFDKELITWSIDGGGDIFFREKHKFCVTNVCGILQLDTNKFSYRFVAEALKYQHSKMTFDYQTKAHPSVIEKLYALPDIELNEQNKYSKLFEVLYSKLGNERKYLEIIKEQKKYLLSNMFI